MKHRCGGFSVATRPCERRHISCFPTQKLTLASAFRTAKDIVSACYVFPICVNFSSQNLSLIIEFRYKGLRPAPLGVMVVGLRPRRTLWTSVSLFDYMYTKGKYLPTYFTEL